MAFHKLNGHFNVPRPAANVDKKSNEQRLYNWVESLHNMHRSYQAGRMSGFLTAERIDLLSKRGFVFRGDVEQEDACSI